MMKLWIPLLVLVVIILYRQKIISEWNFFCHHRRDWLREKWKNWGEPFFVAAILAIVSKRATKNSNLFPSGLCALPLPRSMLCLWHCASLPRRARRFAGNMRVSSDLEELERNRGIIEHVRGIYRYFLPFCPCVNHRFFSGTGEQIHGSAR